MVKITFEKVNAAIKAGEPAGDKEGGGQMRLNPIAGREGAKALLGIAALVPLVWLGVRVIQDCGAASLLKGSLLFWLVEGCSK